MFVLAFVQSFEMNEARKCAVTIAALDFPQDPVQAGGQSGAWQLLTHNATRDRASSIVLVGQKSHRSNHTKHTPNQYRVTRTFNPPSINNSSRPCIPVAASQIACDSSPWNGPTMALARSASGPGGLSINTGSANLL